MIRLSRLADYAVVLTGSMARNPERYHNACDLAGETLLPTPTVSKILAALARAGVLISHRGAKGGYRLARTAREISVADIIGAVDGPIALTMCIEQGSGYCDVEPICPCRSGWQRINDAIRRALDEISLADMTGTPMPIPAAQKDGEAPSALM